MNRSAILIAGLKGGTGKSTFARGLLDYYRVSGLATAAYDGDNLNESLLQHYGERDDTGKRVAMGDPMRGVRAFSVRDVKERDLLIDLLATNADRAIIDLPGGTLEEVGSVVGNADAFFGAYEEAGYSPVVVIVISHIKASAADVVTIIDAFGRRPAYVVCKNLAWASCDEFPYFEGGQMADGTHKYGRGLAALGKVDGHIVNMPKLNVETYWRLDEANLSFAAALASPQLTISDKVRIREWRKEFVASLRGTVLELPAVHALRASA